MISLFKLRKIFNKRLACLFSVFVILLTALFSIPVSAGSVHDEFVFYQACPVVFNFEIQSTNTGNWLDPYSFDFNVCPVASIPADSDTVSSNATDNASDSSVDIFGGAAYMLTCTSSELDTAGGEFIGQASYSLDVLSVSAYSGYDGMTSDYIYRYIYKLNNFWVWSLDYSNLSDNRILGNSNVSFSIVDNQQALLNTRLNYDILVVDSSGSTTILDGHVLYLDSDQLLPGESFGNLTPEFFINHDSSLSEYLDSPADYFFVYVDTWETTSSYSPSHAPDIYLHYIFNPYLNDLSSLYDYFIGVGGGSVSPDNPAFGFVPYTDWLGSAVSGFFDLQIFPGFTLGGVFISVFAFACVMWFLKLVAGG